MIAWALGATDETDRSQQAMKILQMVRSSIRDAAYDKEGRRILTHTSDRWFQLGGVAFNEVIPLLVPWNSMPERLIFKSYIELVTGIDIRSQSVRRFLQVTGFNAICDSEPQKLLWLVTNDVTEWSERDLISLSSRSYLRNLRLYKYCPKIFSSDSTARSVLYLDRLHEKLVIMQSFSPEEYSFVNLLVAQKIVLRESLDQLINYPPGPRSHFTVEFLGQSVVGHGAVKEWFSLTGERMIATFFHIEADEHILNLDSKKRLRGNPEMEMISVGQVLALSVRERVPLGLKMPMRYYAYLHGREVRLSDYEIEDPILYRTLSETLAMNVDDPRLEGMLPMQIGETHVTLTEANKAEMIRAKLNYPPLTKKEKEYLDKMKEGFRSILLPHFLNRDEMLSPGVVRDVTAGQILSVAEFKQFAKFTDGYDIESPQIVLLIEMLEDFDDQQRTDFFRFVTALPRVPLGGLDRLVIPLTVRPTAYAPGILMSARTCFNLLTLPKYGSADELRSAYFESLAQAVTMEE
jgi:hypothetical protein